MATSGAGSRHSGTSPTHRRDRRTATRASGALPAPSRPPALPAAAPASQPAAPAPGPPGHVIVIDPGHNGQNWSHPGDINRLVDIGNGTKACDTTGTATRDGYTEAAYDLDVASRLAAVLTRAGALVVRRMPSAWRFSTTG